ncbi:MAG: hypothetical protein V7633_5389 [Pseudonocardia sp.]|jgi:hypothetical protein
MRPLSTVYAPWWRPATTPEYAATLSRVLSNAGHSQEAEGWRISAAARYDALVLRHPEAFIGHAAHFWLTVATIGRRARLAPVTGVLATSAAMVATAGERPCGSRSCAVTAGPS